MARRKPDDKIATKPSSLHCYDQATVAGARERRDAVLNFSSLAHAVYLFLQQRRFAAHLRIG